MAATAIQLEHVSKRYRAGRSRTVVDLVATTINHMRGKRLEIHSAARGKVDANIWALRDVAFEVPEGAGLGVIGRNGAGKTTLLRAIAGLLEPEEGAVSWRGAPTRETRDAFHSELAYLGHEPALKGDLTGRENLRYCVGIRRAVGDAEIDAALTRTGASEFGDRQVRTMSAGQKRRIALAGVLLADATLWLLDEPTTNLDADGQQLVADLAAGHLAKQGLIVAAVHHSLPLPADRLVGIELAA